MYHTSVDTNRSVDIKTQIADLEYKIDRCLTYFVWLNELFVWKSELYIYIIHKALFSLNFEKSIVLHDINFLQRFENCSTVKQFNLRYSIAVLQQLSMGAGFCCSKFSNVNSVFLLQNLLSAAKVLQSYITDWREFKIKHS